MKISPARKERDYVHEQTFKDTTGDKYENGSTNVLVFGVRQPWAKACYCSYPDSQAHL
jgi:hypothetical protein